MIAPPRHRGYLHVYSIKHRAHTRASERVCAGAARACVRAYVRAFLRACVRGREPCRTIANPSRASKQACVRACVRARAPCVRRPPPSRSRGVAYPLSLQYRRDWHSSGCHPAPFLLRPSPPSAPAHAKTVSSRACAHALARSPGTPVRGSRRRAAGPGMQAHLGSALPARVWHFRSRSHLLLPLAASR
jgi:hypothetical protein